MNRPLRTLVRVGAVLAAVLALVEPAAADNCGTPSDCFGAAGSFNLAALGLLLLASLSLLLDVLPVVGTAKGVAEAVTGRDLLTGQELSWWERALGVVPVVGGVAAIAGIARVGRGLDAAGDIAGMGRHVDDAGTLGRQVDGAPALRETGGRTTEQWDEVLSRVDPDSARAWELRDRYAEDYYEIVRAAGDARIDEVARSSDMTPGEIRQIRDHLFQEEHQLRDRVGRFDADPDIADAWRRLEGGNPLPSDLDLLRHELYESLYMRHHPGATYDQAHGATLEAGYAWDPPQWRPGPP